MTSNKYKIRYFKKGMREVEVNDLEQFKVQIKSFVRNKNYIIQQGIRLLRYKGYSFDLRVLVYKNNKGLWNVIKNYARVARKQDQILTNYSLGGKRLFYDKLYPQLYSIKGESVPKSHHIEKAALQIASCIDNELGPFGELGIDFAIDIHGKLWLLEINTNPGKGPGHYYRNNDYAPEYKYVFDYAEYLCGVFF